MKRGIALISLLAILLTAGCDNEDTRRNQFRHDCNAKHGSVVPRYTKDGNRVGETCVKDKRVIAVR